MNAEYILSKLINLESVLTSVGSDSTMKPVWRERNTEGERIEYKDKEITSRGVALYEVEIVSVEISWVSCRKKWDENSLVKGLSSYMLFFRIERQYQSALS